MALATPEMQVTLLKQAVELSEMTTGGTITNAHMNNAIIQQAMHEAVANQMLVPLIKEYMTGNTQALVRHPVGLFEVMAYIHFLALTKDRAGTEKLCEDLEDGSESLMKNNYSYKVPSGDACRNYVLQNAFSS